MEEHQAHTKTFLEELESPGFAIVIFTIAFTIVWFVSEEMWSLLLLLIFSYLISGIVTTVWSKMRKVYAEPLIPGVKPSAKGHAFFFFMIYVLVGSFAGSYFSQDILGFVQSRSVLVVYGVSIPYGYLVGIDLLSVICTYVYFYFAIYRKSR